MPRPTKRQINIKMPEALIEQLKAKAESLNDTFTDLVIRLCEQGLGSESDRPQTAVFQDKSFALKQQHTASPFEPAQLDKRIADQLAPLQERLVALETSLGELSA